MTAAGPSHEAIANGMRRPELVVGYVRAMNRLDRLAEQDGAVAALARVVALCERYEAADIDVLDCVARAIRREMAG